MRPRTIITIIPPYTNNSVPSITLPFVVVAKRSFVSLATSSAWQRAAVDTSRMARNAPGILKKEKKVVLSRVFFVILVDIKIKELSWVQERLCRFLCCFMLE